MLGIRAAQIPLAGTSCHSAVASNHTFPSGNFNAWPGWKKQIKVILETNQKPQVSSPLLDEHDFSTAKSQLSSRFESLRKRPKGTALARAVLQQLFSPLTDTVPEPSGQRSFQGSSDEWDSLTRWYHIIFLNITLDSKGACWVSKSEATHRGEIAQWEYAE